MSRFFEQSVASDTNAIGVGTESKVVAYTMVDVQDDENGNSVMSEQHRAAIIKTATFEQEGELFAQNTDYIGLDIDDIDAMIKALQEAKKQIVIKRMESATA